MHAKQRKETRAVVAASLVNSAAVAEQTPNNALAHGSSRPPWPALEILIQSV